MLIRTPTLSRADATAVARVEELRRQLRIYTTQPRRWVGSLRRTALARAIQGSNSIEGIIVNLDDAVAAVEDEEPLDAETETWRAIVGYRNAMTYVLQLARDPHFALNEALIKSLHFMMTGHDLRTNPGTWRPGVIYVRNDSTGEIVYEGPDATEVPTLVTELVEELARNDQGVPALARAAMAHLNLVMIHPFSDGNGRMARCLQTLVLAREGILEPQFASVEEYLGANTEAYYRVLADVGRGRWDPKADAQPWLRFMVTAHYRQAITLLSRVKHSEALWALVEELATADKVPTRSLPALFEAASGRRLRRGAYLAIAEAPLSEAAATRDLRQLVDAELLEAHGEKRGRYYRAAPKLAALYQRAPSPRSSAMADPYAEDQPKLN